MTTVLLVYRDGRTISQGIDSSVVCAPVIEQLELNEKLWLGEVTKFRRVSIENEDPILYEEFDRYFADIDVPSAITAIKDKLR